MSWESIQKIIVEVVAVVLVALIIVIIALIYLSPHIAAQTEQADFTKACMEWYKKDCDMGKIDEVVIDSISMRKFCTDRFNYITTGEGDQLDECYDLCYNGCVPIIKSE